MRVFHNPRADKGYRLMDPFYRSKAADEYPGLFVT